MNSEATKANGSAGNEQLVVVLPSDDATCDSGGTKKGRRKASKAKSDGLYCVPTCILNGGESDSMVQCHMCQMWVHPECVGEIDKEIVSI